MPLHHPYASYNRLDKRLWEEYKKYGRLIVAVDFDDTVYDTHNNGWDYDEIFEILKMLQDRKMSKVIIWTTSKPERYPFITRIFKEHGIEFDAINENIDGIEIRGPKVYANIYLDDRSCGLDNAILILHDLCWRYDHYQEDKND